MQLQKKYRRGIFFVVYRKTFFGKIKYLLLKRKLHWTGWEFPKGGIDENENSIQTLKRELREETGLTPEKIIKTNISGKYPYKHEIKGREQFKGQTFKLFIVKVGSKKVIFDKREHTGYKWASYNKALRTLTWPDQKNCLKKANQLINS